MGAAGLFTACSGATHSTAEATYLDEARVALPQAQVLVVGHRACSMLQSGTPEDTIVSTVWPSQIESQAMVSSAHVDLCPDT